MRVSSTVARLKRSQVAKRSSFGHLGADLSSIGGDLGSRLPKEEERDGPLRAVHGYGGESHCLGTESGES